MGLAFTYADESQLYISSQPDETYQYSKLTECTFDIKNWMSNNILLLNSDKIDVLIIASKTRS